jgi:hypothetical protein
MVIWQIIGDGLNVATSRARAVCVLVGSPAIFEAECRTPRQMQLANAFYRYLEIAERQPPRNLAALL